MELKLDNIKEGWNDISVLIVPFMELKLGNISYAGAAFES